jgi:hypothetical protein
MACAGMKREIVMELAAEGGTNMRRQNPRSPMQFMMDYLRRNLLINSSVADLYVSRRKAPRISNGSKDNLKPSRQQSGTFTRVWKALTRKE